MTVPLSSKSSDIYVPMIAVRGDGKITIVVADLLNK
jgi:hypothetical protein